MEEDNQQEDEQSGRGGFDAKLLGSYWSFAKRALKAHKLLFSGILFGGVLLTILVAKYLPRTYGCTTVLMTVENAILDSNRGPRPLAGANGMILRHENLEQLVKQTGLVKKYPERRPALLRLKDRLLASVFGKMDDKTMTAILVGTLEAKISVETKDDNLTIAVEWSDPNTAAELASAVQDGFLQMRHKAEISAFQEKMAIVDSHASKLRQEVESLAGQLEEAATANADKYAKANAAANPGRPARSMMMMARPHAPLADAELPELRERLAALKQTLSAAEAQRNGRISEETAKLNELKLRLMPSHPQVVTQEERVAIASQVSSELALMRSEEQDMQAQVKQREAMLKTGQAPAVGGGMRGTTADGEPLPANVAMVLTREEGDPALQAQLSGAVVRYGALRDEVRAARMELDTAQAAFNHRYQVIIPVEVPGKPNKPNLAAVVGAGLVLSLLLAFGIPVLSELRRGVLVEYWQVDAFHLPVLADLQLPPGGNK
jgi:uncharacterized protein involved in exopolysaccharide biosynthesis